MRTIAIINQKGGCGKTTTAINLAAVLAELGQRTLLVDLDPQAHCAAGLAIPPSRIDFDIGDAMLHVADRALDADRLLWRVSKNLDLAPSRTKLAGLEASRGGLASATERERRLKRVLEQVAARAEGAGNAGEGDPFAYTVIDCPPSIGLLAYNAITAADEIIIPVETSFFSLQGATKQVATIRSLARRLGTRPVARLLATMHDHEHDLARDLHAELERRFKGALIPVTIRQDPVVREAASYGQPVTEYNPSSLGAHDYSALGAWIHEQADAGRVDAVTIEVKQTDVPMGARRKDRGRSAFGRARPLHPRDADEQRGEGRPPERSGGETSGGAGGETGARPAPAATATDTDPSTGPSGTTEAKAISAISRVEDLCRRAQALHDRIRPDTARAEPESTRLRSADGAVRLVERPVDLTRREKSVGRLFGARRAGHSLLFVQPLELGLDVRVAGDFNGWSPDAHPMQRNEAMGVHELSVRVMPGRYQYRLIVDGQWREDQFNANSEMNEFGGKNNVVE